jgi:hypothetical protein
MKYALFMALTITFAVPVVSQTSSEPQASDDSQTAAPATLVGARPSIRPLGELVNPNFVAGGIAISQLYTDNAELSTTGPISDLSYEIMPHLAISSSAVRWSLNADALAGFMLNRTLDNRNQAQQSAGLDFSYRLSQFVTLRASDQFTNSTGLWSGASSGGTSTGAGIGSLQQPNNSQFTFGKFKTNVALAEISGQFSADSYAGVRGTESYLWFPSSATDPVVGTLYGGNSYTAEAFYNRHFTARNWGGITLRAQRFDLSHAIGRTDAVGVLLMYAVNITPSTSLSFFGGPELSMTATPNGIALPVPAFQRRLWSPAAGAVFSWQGQRTGALASFTHQVSNGGGLYSAVTLTTAEVQLQRQVGRHLEFGPSLTFSQNDPIVTSPSIRTYSGQLQSSYRVGSCAFGAGYARDQRDAAAGSLTASANRVWVSFSYDFIRTLGR